jgi:WXG100 protein secretion system (Wss), protein YukD
VRVGIDRSPAESAARGGPADARADRAPSIRHGFIRGLAIPMNMLTIEVWDATGNKKQLVELPSDAPVNRVIAVLVDRMNLPRYSPDGQLMSYKFHHKASGRQLLDDQTLASADIHSGDVLRLQPEITAG